MEWSPMWLGLAAAAVLLCTGLVHRRAAAQDRDARRVQAWFVRAGTALGAGLAAEAALALAPPAGHGAGLTVGALVGCGFAYQGLVLWNRNGTAMSDPSDWLNGVSGVLGALAVGFLVVDQVPGVDALAPVTLAGGLVRVAVLTVLLGTAGTVAAIADLRREPRAVALAVATAVLLAVEVVLLVLAVRTGAQAPATGVLGAAWAGFAVLVATTGRPAPAPVATHDATPQATTWGSVVVIVAGAVVLLLCLLLPRESPTAAVLATAAVLGGSLRVSRLVRDLEALATSRAEARTDTLTGVANRRALLEAVDAGTARPDGAALLVIDLDRFKEINDRYGHATGDRVVQVVAARVAAVTAGYGLLARLGGDEFAVVLDDADPERAVAVGDLVCAAVADPLDVDGLALVVEASVGVASTRLGPADRGDLLRRADAAMYAAKRSGGGVRVHDAQADARVRDRRELVADLRTLLAGGPGAGGLRLDTRPQTAADDEVLAVVAHEVWEHPRRGPVDRAEVVALAGEHGLLEPLTAHLVDAAVRQAARRRSAGQELPVLIALPEGSLELPGLVGTLEEALARWQLPAGLVGVEVVEADLVRDPALALDVVGRIIALGAQVGIADFGTGHATWAHLGDLPVRSITLAATCTVRVADDPRTREVVAATVDLAHRLGVRVVADGVADEATRRLLVDLGCDRTQGPLHAPLQPTALPAAG
jgi:diguanylate cyclase (GGDEF)-like protein